ncbi:two-component sensor histidine kinase [Myroides marinus]|uniref:sensor histidine kinase n=1 Tax=Myroides marinus TaxID=703342 RepID=UPI0025778E98|nr:ATP-binding protein [Myroides marinus]MDM1405547.1 two-component sensor histidine kinase [Myroides marinus]
MENKITIMFWVGTILATVLCCVVIAVVILYQKRLKEYQITLLKQRLSIILEAEHKERARIARELHDGVCSELLCVINYLQIIKLYQDKKTKKDALKQIKKISLNCYKQLQVLSYHLAPPHIKDNALECIFLDFINLIKKSTTIEFSYHYTDASFQIKEKEKLILYRVVQELVQNIIKHSSASKVSLKLVWEQDKLIILISDNGVGYDSDFKSNNAKKGIGLSNIHARLKEINAEFKHIREDNSNTIGIYFENQDNKSSNSR